MSQSPRALEIHHAGDVLDAQAAARDLARELEFADVECEQIALAASELATNLVRHARGGVLRLSAVGESGRAGIALETEDRGPGITDTRSALADGFSTAGGLGLGLGTVHRIMDELEFTARPAGGLKVSCRRWIRPPTAAAFVGLTFGVATRARRLEPHNGDAFVIRRWAGGGLAGVVDGLGHGEHAERAAHAARGYLEDHFDQPVPRLFAGVAEVCRRTRGVVMALARFDLDRRTVDIASVGNVEARLVGSADARNIVVRRGILGVNAPNPVVTAHRWSDDAALVLHSDGLHSHWDEDAAVRLRRDAPGDAAQALLQRYAKEDDDATIVVARSAPR